MKTSTSILLCVLLWACILFIGCSSCDRPAAAEQNACAVCQCE